MFQGTLKGTGEAATNHKEVLLARLSQLCIRCLRFLKMHKGGGEEGENAGEGSFSVFGSALAGMMVSDSEALGR